MERVSSTSPGLKCRRTLVPILIGKIPASATSQSSGKKVAEEEEEGEHSGGGEGPEVANSLAGSHNSALGDLVCLSSPHQEAPGGDWGPRRSVSPLRLGLPQRQARGSSGQTEAFSQTPAVIEGGSHVSQDSAHQGSPRIASTTEPSVNDKEGELKETQTENVCSEEQEVQTEEATGEDEGTQTIPVAMSQANSQTDPSPIQVVSAPIQVSLCLSSGRSLCPRAANDGPHANQCHFVFWDTGDSPS